MKRKTLIRTGLLFMAAVLFTACSSNDDNKENNGTDDGKKVNIAKAVTFKVDFADYNAEQEVGVTRAGNQEEKIGRQVIGLGNGILAQCTLQHDTTKQLKTIATRALPDDTYTMLAYDVATHTLRGELVGNVVGGVFRYSSFGAIEIPAGTYDFVLFNSKVSRSGNLLTVTRANAGDALIGRTTGKVIPASPYNQLVTFTMKHVAAKVKVKLTGYMGFSGIAATLASVNATDVPSSSIYDASTGTWSLGTGAATSDALTYGASQFQAIPNVGRLSVATATEDAFFMPSTDVSKLKLTFTAGTIYNQNMTNTSLTFAPKTLLQLDQNGSYVLNVKLMYRFLYLMSDGTRGFIDKTTFGGGTKTPIAVVVSQSRHMAVALEDAGGGTKYRWTDRAYDWNIGMGHGYYCSNKSHYLHRTSPYNFTQAYAMEGGYAVTWDAAASRDNTTIKGNRTDFPAFYAAGHYTPTLPTGVNLTGKMVGKKWFLPAFGEWKYVYTALGFGDPARLIGPSARWSGVLANSAFTQVGGSLIDINAYRWTCLETVEHDGLTCFFIPTINHPGNVVRIRLMNSIYSAVCLVRPFIIYDE